MTEFCNYIPLLLFQTHFSNYGKLWNFQNVVFESSVNFRYTAVPCKLAASLSSNLLAAPSLSPMAVFCIEKFCIRSAIRLVSCIFFPVCWDKMVNIYNGLNHLSDEFADPQNYFIKVSIGRRRESFHFHFESLMLGWKKTIFPPSVRRHRTATPFFWHCPVSHFQLVLCWFGYTQISWTS